jgi:hypothetical protein
MKWVWFFASSSEADPETKTKGKGLLLELYWVRRLSPSLKLLWLWPRSIPLSTHLNTVDRGVGDFAFLQQYWQ